jgi:hypothetical protein
LNRYSVRKVTVGILPSRENVGMTTEILEGSKQLPKPIGVVS